MCHFTLQVQIEYKLNMNVRDKYCRHDNIYHDRKKQLNMRIIVKVFLIIIIGL